MTAPLPVPSQNCYTHELAIARILALRAGTVLLDCRQNGYDIRRKDGGEIVTTADLAADSVIREGLQTALPDDAIYSEESPGDAKARLYSRRVWIVDPLDSTSNFVSAQDEFAVSIGLAVDGDPAIGVVYLPARNELFLGGPGVGVLHNGRRVQVSDAETLGQVRISVSRKEWQRGFMALAGGIPLVPRASMAHKLARVAAGLDDGSVSLKRRKEWGACAGVALVLGGGGRVTALDGSESRFNRGPGEAPLGLIAAGAKLHGRLLRAVLHAEAARDARRSVRRCG